jgi:hypothetical protein
MSTVREVLSIVQVDDRGFPAGPGTKLLQEGFTELVDEELRR